MNADIAYPTLPEGSIASAIIDFARRLKEAGFLVSTQSVMDALDGVRLVGLESLPDFKTTLQASFMTRIEETPAFERLFREFWIDRFRVSEAGPEQGGSAEPNVAEDGPSQPEDDSIFLAETGAADSQEKEAWNARAAVIYSPREALRDQDFRDLTQGDDPRIDRLIQEILRHLIRREGSRKRPTNHGISIDFRRLLRKSLQSGGEIYELPRLKPKLRLKKIVFLCDVSGSMNPYLRFMLQFIRRFQEVRTKVETFVFATRLSRVTPLLAHAPFSQALTRISEMVKDWSGGTRIGACLNALIAAHAPEMLRPSTVVIVHSDGWDRGDPELLDRAMNSIRRRVYRIIWINPLLGTLSYEPTCRGMKTALPYIDAFLPGNSISGLERVAGTLRGLL
jgi:hypothetical protein